MHTPYDKRKFSKAKINCLKERKGSDSRYIDHPKRDCLLDEPPPPPPPNLRPKIQPKRCSLYVIECLWYSTYLETPNHIKPQPWKSKFAFNINVIYRVFLFSQEPVTFGACVELSCLSLTAKDHMVPALFENENPVANVSFC